MKNVVEEREREGRRMREDVGVQIKPSNLLSGRE